MVAPTQHRRTGGGVVMCGSEILVAVSVAVAVVSVAVAAVSGAGPFLWTPVAILLAWAACNGR